MKQKRSRAYIEITNICNKSCSFCPPHQRNLEMMTHDFFAHILEEIKPFAKELYFHVMGEPTLHPELELFLQCAKSNQFRVNITTNGTFLADTLLHDSIRQINFSLQSFDIDDRQGVFNILNWIIDAKGKRPDCYYNLRFWNHSNGVNHTQLLHEIGAFFKMDTQSLLYDGVHHQIRLDKHIFIHHESLFQWPCMASKKEDAPQSYCLGLADQFAILVNGDVTPCCLDACGELALGNLHKTSLKKILMGEKANLFLNSFQQNIPSHSLCKNCTYRLRFSR